jgi:hypothetical protein
MRVRCVAVVLPGGDLLLVEVGTGESPVDWRSSGVVVLFEGEDLDGELVSSWR